MFKYDSNFAAVVQQNVGEDNRLWAVALLFHPLLERCWNPMPPFPHELLRSARPSPAAPHRPVLRAGPRGNRPGQRDAPNGHGEQGREGRGPRGPTAGPGARRGAHPSASPRGVVRPPRPSCFRGPPRGGFAADDISCGCWKGGGGAEDAPAPPLPPPPHQVPALHRLRIKAPPPPHPPSLPPCRLRSCRRAAPLRSAPRSRGAEAMATVVVEVDSEPSCSIPNPTSTSPSLSHRFLDSKFYLLVVIGELVTEEHLRRAITNIERGEAAGAGAPQAAPRHPPPAPCPSLGAAGSRDSPEPHPAEPRAPALYSPGGPAAITHPPTHVPRGVRALRSGAAGAAASPLPAMAGRRGRVGSAAPAAEPVCPETPAGGRGTVRTAVPVAARGGQRAAGDGVDGLGWGCGAAAARSPRPPPPR